MAAPRNGAAYPASLYRPAEEDGPAGRMNGEGARGAALHPPTGEVKNIGGVLASFERAFKQDPGSIPDLTGWLYRLEDEARIESDHLRPGPSDRNAQRAYRLMEDVYGYLDETGQLPEDRRSPF